MKALLTIPPAEGGGLPGFLRRHRRWFLVLILAGAFLIRVYGQDRVIDESHDEVNPMAAGFRLAQSRWLPTGPWEENFFVQLFLYYNGATSPLIQFINLHLLNLLGIPLREAFLFLPYAVVGTLSLLGLYFLGRRWFDPETGLLAALFGALAAYHIAVSRINHPMVGIFFIQVFLFLSAERLFTRPRQAWAILVSLLLVLEALSNNGFFFTLVILAYYLWWKARELGGRRELLQVIRTSRLLWWAFLPLCVILLQVGLFAVALVRGELIGLLAWSLGHQRPWSFSFESIRLFGSAFNYFFLALTTWGFLAGLRRLFHIDKVGFLTVWVLVGGIPFLLVFFAQPVHLIATCGIPLLLLGAHTLRRLLTAVEDLIRSGLQGTVGVHALSSAGGLGVLLLVLAEGTSGALAVNFFLPTPNRGWYVKAEGQGALGWTEQYRGVKSAGYWIRRYGAPEGRVYVNHHSHLSELYFNKVWCACRDAARRRLFVLEDTSPDPPVDYFVLYEWGPVPKAVREAIERYHLVGEVRDRGERLARIYGRRPQPRVDLEHREAVQRFNETYARLDRFVTSPYVGMTFWLK